MPKVKQLLTLLFLVIGFSVMSISGQETLSQIAAMPKPDVEIYLDKTEIHLPCPPGAKNRGEGCQDSIVDVTTSVSSNDLSFTYNYEISGGRIIGQGKKVAWDLSSVRPGTHKITVSVEGNCSFCGKPVTKQITVSECTTCEGYCFCPQIFVNSTKGTVKPGQNVYFNARTEGGWHSGTYKWKVSGGKIVTGQGTSAIVVSTKRTKSKYVVATAKILSVDDCTSLCITEASEKVKVTIRRK